MRWRRSVLDLEARDLTQQVASLLHEEQQLSTSSAQGQGFLLATAATPVGKLDAVATGHLQTDLLAI